MGPLDVATPKHSTNIRFEAAAGVTVSGDGKQPVDSHEISRSKHSGGGGVTGTDGKSARSSFAGRSLRSRKLERAQQVAQLEALSDRATNTEATLDELKNQVEHLLAKHQQGWDLISINRQIIQETVV